MQKQQLVESFEPLWALKSEGNISAENLENRKMADSDGSSRSQLETIKGLFKFKLHDWKHRIAVN